MTKTTMEQLPRPIRSLAAALVVGLASACRQPHSSPPRPSPATWPITSSESPQPPSPPPTVASAKPPPSAPKRWLYAERFAPGTSDGYVEGDFSEKRNRIAVKTYAVTRFAIDTRNLSIDWDRLVVIRINGHNSELKRRHDPVLHFVLDPHHQWVVEE